MTFSIRTGSLEELVSVNQQISEFRNPYGLPVFSRRLADRPWLGLVACEEEKLLGFKLGYEKSPDCFYSWLGGVVPSARGRGIARALLHEQERWVASKGYHSIHVKSRNRYAAMLGLLLSEGYEISDITVHDPISESRIHFLKQL